jgi:acyl-CoA thioester hydrolase
VATFYVARSEIITPLPWPTFALPFSADYLAPARFDDVLEVRTRIQLITGARLVLAQSVERGSASLFEAIVTLVCLGEAGQPIRLPANIRRITD